MKMDAFQIPLRTGLGLNSREHWATRAKRVKTERFAVFVAFPRDWLGEAAAVFGPAKPGPWLVTLTRGSSGTLDDDNLRGSLKACRDEVARLMGLDDRDPRVVWRYEQVKLPRGSWGVIIRLQDGEHARHMAKLHALEAPPNEQKPPAIAPKPRTRGRGPERSAASPRGSQGPSR